MYSIRIKITELKSTEKIIHDICSEWINVEFIRSLAVHLVENISIGNTYTCVKEMYENFTLKSGCEKIWTSVNRFCTTRKELTN
jgi:hypothetical protein